MTDDIFEDVIAAYEKFERTLEHYGTPRRSGRYPWGSGGDAYQRNKDFLGYVNDLSKQGMSDREIVDALGLGSTTKLRALKSSAKAAKKEADIAQALRLKDKGLSQVAIGERMGINESSVRDLLNPKVRERNDILKSTTDFLRTQIDTHGYIDVGAGVEHLMSISETKKKVALAQLEEEGYKKFYLKVEQLGTGKETNLVLMTKAETTFPDVVANKDKIRPPMGYSEDGGRTYEEIKPPKSINSKRVGVRYGDEGGADKDGVIELRRDVDDISLGSKRYAQVRIAVDGTHYLKGMAMYSDNLPDGVDMVFNTNKKNTGNKLDAMKSLKEDKETGEIDQDLPFGSIVRQKTYVGKNGKEAQSVINIVSDNEEGRWSEWSRNLSSQMLSKQSPSLAREQLGAAYKMKRDEYEEIMKLTNPAVKKKLLEEFSDGADASSVHLKAAGLPRTRNQVILPINSLKDNEVYAPQFNNGETVVLIRHPHGGTFEIPELKVNNRNREALSVIRQAEDAVGINANVAKRLSGADFDGDTVLVIPNNSGKIKTSARLARLKNFDPQMYKIPEGSGIPKMTGKQQKMGDISNLITDMTIKKASHDEIARAVAHSMVVIDAEKHDLNYKQSYQDFGIADLKKKYQGGANRGASTLISRSKSQDRVDERSPRKAADGGPVDPATGKKVYTYSGRTYVNKNGVVKRVPGQKSTKMAETDDAYTLSSGTVMEAVYADHANRLKALANDARKNSLAVKPTPYNQSARETYKEQVDQLAVKLRTAQRNAPLERKAQLVAGTIVDAKKKSNPDMDPADLKKIKGQALTTARARVGAGKERVTFTPLEWEAIQAGAVSNNRLQDLLNHADMDQVRELATPRARTVMTDPKIAMAKSMLNRGYTQAEIANSLGVPASTLNDALK